MTDNNHPITPPPGLVLQWLGGAPKNGELGISKHIATQAARWGADTELEACCEWAAEQDRGFDDELRAARRPKPPSLKAQALAALDDAVMRGDCMTISDSLPTIRRALEALDD